MHTNLLCSHFVPVTACDVSCAGTELGGRPKAIQAWPSKLGIEELYVVRGSLRENGYAERVHPKQRDEFLSGAEIATAAYARHQTIRWWDDNDDHRPQSSLECLVTFLQELSTGRAESMSTLDEMTCPLDNERRPDQDTSARAIGRFRESREGTACSFPLPAAACRASFDASDPSRSRRLHFSLRTRDRLTSIRESIES
jgi:hypothetical protein